jgi:hypothetical protein
MTPLQTVITYLSAFTLALITAGVLILLLVNACSAGDHHWVCSYASLSNPAHSGRHSIDPVVTGQPSTGDGTVGQ